MIKYLKIRLKVMRAIYLTKKVEHLIERIKEIHAEVEEELGYERKDSK